MECRESRGLRDCEVGLIITIRIEFQFSLAIEFCRCKDIGTETLYSVHCVGVSFASETDLTVLVSLLLVGGLEAIFHKAQKDSGDAQSGTRGPHDSPSTANIKLVRASNCLRRC